MACSCSCFSSIEKIQTIISQQSILPSKDKETELLIVQSDRQ